MVKESNLEHVCVTIVHPAFCVFLYLTGVHFRGKLQHSGDATQQKISKKSVSTNQNSENRWFLTVRHTICLLNILLKHFNFFRFVS